MTLEQLQAALEATPFARTCGMRIVEVDPEAQTCRIDMPLDDGLQRLRGSGQFHGGAIAALIDTAGTFALAMAARKPVPTINFRTDFVRPAIDSPLSALARVRRIGRSVGVVDVDVTNRDDELVALGRGTFGT